MRDGERARFPIVFVLSSYGVVFLMFEILFEKLTVRFCSIGSFGMEIVYCYAEVWLGF